MKRSTLLTGLLVSTLSLNFAGVVFAEDAPQKTEEKFQRFPPVEPKDAEKTFKCLDGFEMQLLAAEPLVTDPVAMAYDENGLAYVVEMNDYPYTDKATHQAWKENTTDKPIGKIRVLEDTNGDGKFDKSYILVDGLSWPGGICCWKGGVFVIATPDIWYFKDTDGDHKADVKRKVFTGFRKYNVQAVANNLIWGLDNKIYGAGSGNGGEIVAVEGTNKTPVKLSHNDFRFDPETEKFEALSGGARFGNTFDDWGHRFVCNIRNPCQQIVLEKEYLDRNPYLTGVNPVYDSREPGDNLQVFRISPIEPWRDVRAKQWTAESKNIPHSELTGGGVFTSASGITIFRGAAYPSVYKGNAFVAEVANNLIHRQTLTSDGIVFKAERADKDAEFVASTDTWFRPVNFVNAPDGTLHVLDMYREVIEHPWSIPDQIREKLDLESGRDRGRIYRLAPKGFQAPKPPQLGKASTAELVAALENPSSWWRETAQRLLIERQDKAAVEPLKKMCGSLVPTARLHALWALQGLNALGNEEVLTALGDQFEGVQENALRLGESRLGKPGPLAETMVSMLQNPSKRVCFQAALSLANFEYQGLGKELRDLLKAFPEDPWIRTAVLSGNPNLNLRILIWAIRDQEYATRDYAKPLLRQAMFSLGAQNKKDNLYDAISQFEMVNYCQCYIREDFVCGLGDGLRLAGKNFRTVFTNANSIGAIGLSNLLRFSYEIVPDRGASYRLENIKFLAYDSFEGAKPHLVKVLDPQEPSIVQIEAIRSLSSFKEPEVAKLLLAPWKTYTPDVREHALTALFLRKERLKALLDAIEAGEVSPTQIGPARKTQLLTHSDAAIKERAAKLFGQTVATSRKEVVDKYTPALSMKGDRANGEKVFENSCMVCHRHGGKGTEIGPNLETVRDWDHEKILVNILDPNREVAPNFLAYDVELKDGSSISGLIASENSAGIVLKRQGAAEETISRQNINKISSSGMSLMPEGLETAIQPQDMADLLEFLTSKN